MPGGRTYVDKMTIGGIDVFEVTSDPNGVLLASQGSLAIRSDTSEVWQNLDGLKSWGRQPFQVRKQRVQLADLPNNASPPPVPFAGGRVNPHQVIVGSMMYVNALDVGASGITSLLATCSVSGANMFSGVDLLVGGVVPGYRNAFTDEPDWTKGPVASTVNSFIFYILSCNAATLDALAAFDVTFLVFVSPVILPVP